MLIKCGAAFASHLVEFYLPTSRFAAVINCARIAYREACSGATDIGTYVVLFLSANTFVPLPAEEILEWLV